MLAITRYICSYVSLLHDAGIIARSRNLLKIHANGAATYKHA